jgi:RNA polymerase sigma-70 factor (ECF subfamily)
MSRNQHKGTGNKGAAGPNLDFGHIYKTYYATVRKTIFSRFADMATAEDVLQEFWIKIILLLSKYKPEGGTLFNWLRKLAVNHANDFKKHGDFKRGKMMTELEETTVADDINFSECINYDALDLHKYLEILKKRDRDIVILHYYQGVPQSEIAEARNMPLSTVKDILQKSVKKLRNFFAGDVHKYNGG